MLGQVRHSRGSKTRAVWEICCLSVDVSNDEFYAHITDPLLIYHGPHQGLIADIRVSKENDTAEASRILYIGCGNGDISIRPGREKYYEDCLGFSSALLVESRQCVRDVRISDVELGEWNTESGQRPYPDNAFDSISILQAFHAIKNPVFILKELFRVIKPSGRLILVEPKHLARLTIRSKANRSEMLMGGKIHSFDEEHLRSNLEAAGFRIDSIESGDSELTATAFKPRYYFEMKGYRFVSAESREDLEKVFRLRYQVYCVDLGVEPSNDSGLQKDIHDDYAINFLGLDSDDRPIGTLRAVPNNPKGFPMESDFPLKKYMKENGISRAVEGGRFAISRVIPREDRATVGFGLMKGLIDYCRETGVNDIFNTTQLKIVKRFEMPGFCPIGEPFEYAGCPSGLLWVPMRCNLKEAYENYAGTVNGYSDLP